MSTEPTHPNLKVGGAVNSRKDVYIIRPSDDEVYDLLVQGEYCNVLCSRQMGKTSLLLRAKVRLAEAGVRTVLIDAAGYFGSVPPESADAWYQDLLQEISDQLALGIDVAVWWQAQMSATPNRRLIGFFRDQVGAKADMPVVIILDEIDSTLKLPYADDLFVAIRAMYNDRPREPTFERVTFCLVGVATPNELIKDRRTTPYNVGRTIELRDFDLAHDDLAPLYSAMSNNAQKGEILVRAALWWSGGHPYLTMRLCEEISKQGAAGPEDVDLLVARAYSNLDAAKSDVHFETVLRFVSERVDDRLTALTLYRRIYRGRRESDRTTPAHIALKLSGLVKRDRDNLLIVRNEIYRSVFTARWATNAMPVAE
jgi:AAA-like domain